MKKSPVEIIIKLILLFGLLSFVYRIGYRTGYYDGAVKYYRTGYIECADSINKKLEEIIKEYSIVKRGN